MNAACQSDTQSSDTTIGAACAWRFAELGCKLVLLARRVDRLIALQAQLQQSNPHAVVHVAQLDMQDLESIKRTVDALPPDLRDVDILVNNAGLALGTAPVHENDLQDIATMLSTNVMGLIALTRHISAGMVERNRGHIVNVSSVAGHEAYAGGSGYCASKFAVDAFTTASRHDLVGTNIRVTAISPGTETPPCVHASHQHASHQHACITPA